MNINIRNIILSGIVIAILLSVGACRDMLETDSDRVAFEEDNTLNSPEEMFYTVSGILKEMQKIGDRYVVLGELRGDLMTTAQDASVSLKNVNYFQVDQENEFLDKRDFYNIINHCNYALQKMDTTLFLSNEKVMMPTYAMIKSMRAWTYMQLGLIYGSAIYIEKPILSLEASLGQYPIIELDELFGVLANDLLPYANIKEPESSSVPTRFIPVKALLGDIYLYQGKYNEAAQMYYGLLDPLLGNFTLITDRYATYWANSTYDGVNIQHTYSYLGEAIAGIDYSDDIKDLHSGLVGMTYNGKASLLPSPSFVESMSTISHFHQSGSVISITEGDLRGTVYNRYFSAGVIGTAYRYVTFANTSDRIPLISKFYSNSKLNPSGSDPNNNLIVGGLAYLDWLAVLRNVHVYLRYAEAINRAGKPSLAFAVLKYGLKSTTLSDPAKVNPSELASGESYIDFQNVHFDENIGTAARGRGFGISTASSTYVIPDFTDSPTARQDSIEWVEERILEEMAAETAFEGNRFFDLLRVSKRRNNHPAFMADKVSHKYTDPESMKTLLSTDINAWFVKP